MIESAPRVELVIRDNSGVDVQRLDVTRARGTPNIRHTLGRDFAYLGAFKNPEMMKPGKWTLVFSDGAATATLGFDEECRIAVLGDKKHAAAFVEPASELLKGYFAEQVEKQRQ